MNDELIGQIVPAGIGHAQWLYVTRIDGEAVYGRTWLARSSRWSKTERLFGRRALHHTMPRVARPDGFDAAKVRA
jgi:hypothetical protein